MLCEGILLSMTYGAVEDSNPLPDQNTFHAGPHPPKPLRLGPTRPAPLVHHSFLEQAGSTGSSSSSESSYIPPLQSSSLQTARLTSPKIQIPAQAGSGGGDSPFLVPSFCESICKNYSDLHIGGEQVLPLSANDGELRVGAEAPAGGPFLQSCDVPADVGESLPGRAFQGGPGPLGGPLGGASAHWRQASGRDRSFLLQGREGPFSNSLLNHYLEQKLLDLYQQYMMENMGREGAAGSESGNICPLLGSELVLTSLDQITLQLSREGNLEAGLAKDMVLSCLLRVAGDMHSSEISTPVLQISNEASTEQLTASEEE
ncbi:TLR adapter interacting with SLC15A4 on the lysosome [Cololabis saira]|uniref:TLR adapter interacting with SLC15A4 on the lysosome n=1 Tax=Cololabis saira TaxID=129043 RepID=UPI002AD27FFA|nr:TLR adapter interacting with SLC15A4 on the lysosome [Cololabis saira]